MAKNKLLKFKSKRVIYFMKGQDIKTKQFFSVLARTIHALARFGDDLFVESQADCLVLRTLNSAESAYAAVKFNTRFFSHFAHDYYATEDDSALKCKISIKSALNVFKSPAQLDKQVEKLEVKLEPAACKLVFVLVCRHGVVKTHHVHILDCKAMRAVFTTDTAPNKIMASQRVLTDALSNLHNSDDQVTLEVSPLAFLLRNYTHDGDATKLIRTQVNVRPVQFDSYVVGVDTKISFSCKEFRALLTFAEALNLPLQLNFEAEGKPIVFVVHNSSTFEATFVLATAKSDAETAPTTPATSCREDVGSARKRRALKTDEDELLFDFAQVPYDSTSELNKDATNRTSELNSDSAARDIAMETEVEAAHVKVCTLFKRCFDETVNFRNTQHVILKELSDSE